MGGGGGGAPEVRGAKQAGSTHRGGAWAATGVSAKMSRHYEGVGLIPEASRTFAVYRLYCDADLHRLRFIKRSRNLGFSMKQIETLLALWSDQHRASSEVKKLAQPPADELAETIGEMQAMQRTRTELEKPCHRHTRPAGPIPERPAG